MGSEMARSAGWVRSLAALASLAAAACGPAPIVETNAQRFETYRPQIIAKKEEIQAILHEVPREPHAVPVSADNMPRYTERGGTIQDTNILFMTVSEFRTGEKPEFDLYFSSPLNEALDFLDDGVEYPDEAVSAYTVAKLDAALATPFAAFYIIDEVKPPVFVKDKTFDSGVVKLVVLLFDLKQKMVVAQCQVQAVSSENVDFTYSNGDVAEGLESAAMYDLKRNTRRQMALCLSEQTGAKLEVLD